MRSVGGESSDGTTASMELAQGGWVVGTLAAAGCGDLKVRFARPRWQGPSWTDSRGLCTSRRKRCEKLKSPGQNITAPNENSAIRQCRAIAGEAERSAAWSRAPMC